MAEFPVADEDIKALRIKLLRDLAAATYPKEAIGPIAAKIGLTVGDVKSVVEGYGFPSKSEMARHVIELTGAEPVARPATPQQLVARRTEPPPPISAAASAALVLTTDMRIETLLNAASKSDKARTRRLGVKIHELVAELRGLINSESAEREASEKADAEKALLLAEVKKLEDQLAAKKAALRGRQPAKRVAAAVVADKDPSTRNGQIRAWAAGQGLDCNTHGRIPAAVVEAYDEAHTTDGS